MYRSLFLTFCTLGLVGGCAQPQWPMEPPQKPGPAPEMAKLGRMVGSWSGTAEIVSPSPEAMKEMMPEGSDEMPSSFAGGWKTGWALGGMFLYGHGWHEMGEEQKVNYFEYWTWDPKAKKYRTWFFSDWGESGRGWATFDPDGDTIRMKAHWHDAQGASKRGEGTMTFVDNDTIDWTWSERGPMGKMEFKGTSKRKR